MKTILLIIFLAGLAVTVTDCGAKRFRETLEELAEEEELPEDEEPVEEG